MSWRLPALGLAVGVLAAYSWMAVAAYQHRAAVDRSIPPEGATAWILGPPAEVLNQAARDEIDAGLAALNANDRHVTARIDAYRAHLEKARTLLARSQREQPTQASTLSRLAALHWELALPRTEEEERRYLPLVRLASEMGPRNPRVQLRLGRLLLTMDRRDDALPYLERTIDLDPRRSGEAITLLRERGLGAEEIHGLLPHRPEVLLELGPVYFDDEQGPHFLDLLEADLGTADGRYLAHYGNACLRAREPERLLDRLSDPLPGEDTGRGAERHLQRSRAYLVLQDPERAMEAAREARSLQPHDPRVLEHLGRAALAAGEGRFARGTFRNALGLVARGHRNPVWRARLYREIGQAEEHMGRPDLAYDAYRRALDLDPDEPIARRRLDQMRQAAGIAPEEPAP